VTEPVEYPKLEADSADELAAVAAAVLEAAEQEAAAARRREAAAKLKAQQARGILEAHLGDGEAIAAPSGRFAWRDPDAPLGNAELHLPALLEAAPHLPDYLRPVMTWKGPSVTELREADKRGELEAAGVTLAELIVEAERGAKIRWRTA
jgi:hypothetical protein